MFYFDYSSYWTHYESELLSSNYCDNLIYRVINDEQLVDSEVINYGNVERNDYRTSRQYWMDQQKYSDVYQKVVETVLEINKYAFNLDLLGIENIQFTEYSIGEKFSTHADILPDSHKYGFRKLTVSIQLSNPRDYEGGELKIYPKNISEPYVMNKSQGSMLSFPSYVLHEACPVTKGKRYALVAWFIGEKYK